MNEIFQKLSKFTGQKYLIIDDNTTDLDHQPAMIVVAGPDFETRLKLGLEDHFDADVDSVEIRETKYGFELTIKIEETDDQILALIKVSEL